MLFALCRLLGGNAGRDTLALGGNMGIDTSPNVRTSYRNWKAEPEFSVGFSLLKWERLRHELIEAIQEDAPNRTVLAELLEAVEHILMQSKGMLK